MSGHIPTKQNPNEVPGVRGSAFGGAWLATAILLVVLPGAVVYAGASPAVVIRSVLVEQAERAEAENAPVRVRSSGIGGERQDLPRSDGWRAGPACADAGVGGAAALLLSRTGGGPEGPRSGGAVLLRAALLNLPPPIA